MKKYITTTFIVFAAFAANAQVSIGGKQSVEGDNDSTLLDFNSDSKGNKVAGTGANSQGIILPAVDNTANALAATTSYNNGTFLFDKSDKKVKMYENGVWVDLSGEGNDTRLVINTSGESSAEQGAIIGSKTSNAKGILVLEHPEKAMILPRIANPHTTVKNPYAGMMGYDTVSKSLAVFDGENWHYWK